MTDTTFWIFQTLNALQLSALFFLLSIGLSVIFGLMNFVNLAHGSIYAFGAFVGYSAVTIIQSYWGGFVFGPIASAALGGLLYQVLIKRMAASQSTDNGKHSGPLNQVLVTFGLIFVLLDVFRMIWGDFALGIDQPELLNGAVPMGDLKYPYYRIFIIFLGGAIALALWITLAQSKIGMMIRAGVDNADMAACMGVNVERLFFLVFCFGCGLAGLAGVVAAPGVGIYPGMGIEILIPSLIVVVIGGMGSLRGAVVGALLVGFIQTFGAVLAPQISGILIYVMLAGVLILRPNGLFPARGTS